MALDGVFLNCIKNELNSLIIGSKVDKIYQPNNSELLLFLRIKNETFKLLLSIRPNSPRIHITQHSIENPQNPPMLCMLFRKKLIGAKLINIRQIDLERALYLDFDTINEIGNSEKLTLIIEIMGNCSNVILIDQNKKIIDSLKRVSSDVSSKRQILPGIMYEFPPKQDKLCILNTSLKKLTYCILKDNNLSSSILNSMQGLSPIICKEFEYKILNMNKKTENNVFDFLTIFLEKINLNKLLPYMIVNNKTNVDFSYMEFTHNKNYKNIVYNSFSQLLDDFYYQKDTVERIKNKSYSFTKKLKNTRNRLTKKIKIQENELNDCNSKDKFKIFGDLLTANMYKLKKNDKFLTVDNFYSQDNSQITISLDPQLNASQNAQKYYKKYKKAKTAELILKSEIEKAKREIDYINTVLYEIYNATTTSELNDIEQELLQVGYIKKKRKIKAKEKSSYLKFISDDGFIILVGNNNIQNDELTFKIANKNDIWLHAKDIPGSHTIIHTEKRTVTEKTLFQAATLAAFYSKFKLSPKVSVDYTTIKNVKKIPNSKPGMVTYSNFSTLFVFPDENIVKNLRFFD